MSVEARMLASLEASSDAALVRATKSYGYVPQDDEKFETLLPLLVVQRVTAEFISDICGTYIDCCFVNVAIAHIARGAEEARTQAQAATLALITSGDQPYLESENEDYDADLRGWVVTQTWRVFDDAPDVTQP